MDDHELEKHAGPTPRRPGFGGGGWLLVLVVLAVVGGGAGWWWLHRTAAPVAPPIAAPATAVPAPAAAPVTAVDAAGQRDLLEGLSVNASYRGWLKQGDVLERWAVVTDNLAEGVSPRARLRFLAPKEGFKVARRGDRLAISSASYARYDLFSDAVGSVDVAAAVGAYRALHGLLEAAYRAIGYPEGSLDRVTAAALKRLAAAPVRDGDVFVEASAPGPDALYLHAAPELERLGAIEKHLLRMGPRNTRIIQAKARQLERALGFTATETR